MGPEVELEERVDIIMEACATKENGDGVKQTCRSDILMEACSNKENGGTVKHSSVSKIMAGTCTGEESKSVLREPEISVKDSETKEGNKAAKENEDMPLKCASNYVYYNFEVDASAAECADGTNKSEDVEVDITGSADSGVNGIVEAECVETTEASSSFEDTVSDAENGTDLNNAEVSSEYHCDGTSAISLDGFGEIFRFRKKKLSSQWRARVQPLVWRCKWAELQIRKFQSQARKYERELAKYSQRRQSKLENLTQGDLGAKSFQYTSDNMRDKVMKRKRRRRYENIGDISAYMSRHNLFSYYENGKSAVDGVPMDADWGNRVVSAEKINGLDEVGVDDELLWLKSTSSDSSLEEILRKIEVLQGQVIKMKSRLEKVTSENAGKFSFTDNWSFLGTCNALTSSAPTLASPPNNGDRMPVGSSCIASQLLPEYNMGDVVMPESAVSHRGVVNHIPDIIESADHVTPADMCNINGDGVLIYNSSAKEEMTNFEQYLIQPRETPQVPNEEHKKYSPPVQLEPDVVTDDQPAPKTRSISKLTANKSIRRRGRRKTGKRSRRS